MPNSKKKKSSALTPQGAIPLQPGDEDLIRVSDFSSARVAITLKNTTTHTTAKEDPPISIAEFLDRGLILEVPARTCSKGHAILLEMTVTLPNGEEFEFSSTSKVENHEPIAETGTDRITVSLVQFDEIGWKQLQDAFRSRQDEIENFLKAARGY